MEQNPSVKEIVKEIVKQFLEDHGYEGLYSDCQSCGCGIDDLMPCQGKMFSCRAGHQKDGPARDECLDGDDCPFHIAPRPKGRE